MTHSSEHRPVPVPVSPWQSVLESSTWQMLKALLTLAVLGVLLWEGNGYWHQAWTHDATLRSWFFLGATNVAVLLVLVFALGRYVPGLWLMLVLSIGILGFMDWSAVHTYQYETPQAMPNVSRLIHLQPTQRFCIQEQGHSECVIRTTFTNRYGMVHAIFLERNAVPVFAMMKGGGKGAMDYFRMHGWSVQGWTMTAVARNPYQSTRHALRIARGILFQNGFLPPAGAATAPLSP